MSKQDTVKIKVADFYQPELLKYVPEDMFDLLDEANYYNRKFVKVPYYLFEEYLKLNPDEKLNGVIGNLN